MAVPEQLVEMDAYIDEVGRLGPYEASQFRKLLSEYERYAERYHDPVLAAEVERLRAKVDVATQAPVLHISEPQSRPELEREAAAVWAQMSPEEQAALFPQFAGQELPVESLTGRELVLVADYPRSQARREYLHGHQAGRQVGAYRRWRH